MSVRDLVSTERVDRAAVDLGNALDTDATAETLIDASRAAQRLEDCAYSLACALRQQASSAAARADALEAR